MSEAIYVGKLNYSTYASNENIIVDLPDGWVTGRRARVWSTWTEDASGTKKSLAFGPNLAAYALQSVNDDTFVIRDFQKTNYYWFSGTRLGNSISLSMLNNEDVTVQSNILLKLHE